MSLFGQPKPTSSLFGNVSIPTTSQSQPAQSASLFSHTAGSQPPPQQSSLFTGLGGQSNPQTTSSGAAGGQFNTSQPAGSQFQQVSNPFPSQNITTGPQASGTTLSSSLQPQQQQQGQTTQPEQQDGQQSAGLGKVSQPAYFNTLLEKGKQRANASGGGNGFNELPNLQLGLGDIAKRARELGGLGSQTPGGATIDGKALVQKAA